MLDISQNCGIINTVSVNERKKNSDCDTIIKGGKTNGNIRS